MLSIDPWNILWTVVNLLVLYLVFKKFLFKPVMKVINAREDMIKQQFDDAKKSQEEADALKASYDEKLESAKTEADEIIVNARKRESNGSCTGRYCKTRSHSCKKNRKDR